MADLTLGTIFSANATQFVQTVDLMKRKVGELNAAFISVGSKGAKGIDKASKSVSTLGASMEEGSKKADKHKKSLRGVAGALDRVKTAAKITASFAAAAAAIGAVTRALAEGGREIIDYDQGLKNLQAITNATDQEVAGMGETIKDVARTTKFSTGEVAEGMVLLGQAGFSATESMQSMKSVAELATGTLSSMQFTADLMTTTIRAFGMSTVESAKAADIMANAINRSKLTIDKLRIAFNFVGAAAHQAGLTLEETAATMMVLANQGLRASTIGTGLRQVLSRLLSPTGRLREEFEAANIELKKVNPSIVGFRNALENLLPIIYDQTTGTVDMAKAYRLFGLRGAQAAAVMASAVASGNYDKMLELTYETGTAARMAAKQAEGLGLMIKNLADRARLAAVAIGEAGLIGGLKRIITVLKVLVTGFEDFIKSTLGNLLVSWVGWTASIYASVKALTFFTRVVKVATAALTRYWKVLVSTNIAQTLFGKGGFSLEKIISGIGNVAKMGGLRLLGLAGAIGVLVAAVTTWLSISKVQIRNLEKEQSQTETNISALQLYTKVMEDLIKKQQEGVDIGAEHGRVIRRMSSDLSHLKLGLNESAEAAGENAEKLKEAFAAQNTIAIQRQVELISRYKAEMERANFWSGLFNATMEYLNGVLRETVEVLWVLAGGKGWEWLGRKMEQAAGSFWTWIKNSEYLSSVVSDVTENANAWVDRWKEIIKSYASDSDDLKEKTKEANDAMVRLAKFVSQDPRLKGKSLDEIIKRVELLSGLKVDPTTFDAIKDALSDTTLKLKEEQEKWKEEIDQLPVYFQEMYKEMDALRKADFAKAVKAMQSELAAFDKTAREMGLKDEEIYAARNAIRARHLAKFEADSRKEVKVTEEAARQQLDSLNILEQGTKEFFHRKTTAMINQYLKEREAAKDNAEKLKEIDEKFAKDNLAAHKTLNKELLAVDQQRRAITGQLEKQVIEEIKKLHTEMMEDLKGQLQSRYDELKKQRDDFIRELADVDKSYEDILRDIRRKTMTDEEKWLDDRQRAHELMNKAAAEGDVEVYKEAARLAEGLAREVRDENGKVVSTIEENARIASNLVMQIHEAHRNLVKQEISDREIQMRNLKQDMKELEEGIKRFAEQIDITNRKALIVETDETVENLSEVYNINSRFKRDWDALKDKTITLTVKYNYVGSPPSSGREETSEGEGGGESETESKQGGYITRKLGGAIHRLMSFGGKLTGYGGGDKVPARLEPGEFVIRKEAVKKYGGEIFSALNKMQVPDVMSSVGKRLGGMIDKTVQGFRGGGMPIPAHASSKPIQNIFNINLSPKYLTGDRQAMRAVAEDIGRALEEQSRRWGKK